MSLDFDKCELKIIAPKFGDNLTTILMRLEQLRSKEIGSYIHPRIFFGLKRIFHLLESIGSARIEGNRTTISEYVDNLTLAPSSDQRTDDFLEIKNMDKALEYIDDSLSPGGNIKKAFILELHNITVTGLALPPNGEGDGTPGKFRTHNVQIKRTHNVQIKNAAHKPPESIHIDSLMEELISFINENHKQQFYLLKTAIAHHRFAWIHPFGNGNGRVVRLLTYAMLVTQGFDVKSAGRIINPTAVFCNDRDKYVDMLAKADSYEEENYLAWCEYVLGGLEHEVKKIDRLLDIEFTKQKIILPAIDFCEKREHITKKEAEYLRIMGNKIDCEIRAKDFIKLDSSVINRSRFINHLKERKLISTVSSPKSRRYILVIFKGPLSRGIIHSLHEHGFMEGMEE